MNRKDLDRAVAKKSSATNRHDRALILANQGNHEKAILDFTAVCFLRKRGSLCYTLIAPLLLQSIRLGFKGGSIIYYIRAASTFELLASSTWVELEAYFCLHPDAHR